MAGSILAFVAVRGVAYPAGCGRLAVLLRAVLFGLAGRGVADARFCYPRDGLARCSEYSCGLAVVVSCGKVSFYLPSQGFATAFFGGLEGFLGFGGGDKGKAVEGEGGEFFSEQVYYCGEAVGRGEDGVHSDFGEGSLQVFGGFGECFLQDSARFGVGWSVANLDFCRHGRYFTSSATRANI